MLGWQFWSLVSQRNHSREKCEVEGIAYTVEPYSIANPNTAGMNPVWQSGMLSKMLYCTDLERNMYEYYIRSNIYTVRPCLK